MVLAASDMTGWWVGYGIGLLVVVIVVVVVGAIIATAKKIGDVAEDATRALALTRDRTEVLWAVSTTNQVARDLLAGATKARHALGGTEDPSDAQPALSRKGLGGVSTGLAGEVPGAATGQGG